MALLTTRCCRQEALHGATARIVPPIAFKVFLLMVNFDQIDSGRSVFVMAG